MNRARMARTRASFSKAASSDLEHPTLRRMSATIVDHLGMCEGRSVATPRLPQSSFARRLGIVLYVSADCSRCASRRCCSSSVPLNAQHQPFLNHTSGLIALVAANLFVVVIAMSLGRMGTSGRKISQSHSRGGVVRHSVRAMGRELANNRYVSHASRTRFGSRQWPLRRFRGLVVRLRSALRQGKQWARTRGHDSLVKSLFFVSA